MVCMSHNGFAYKVTWQIWNRVSTCWKKGQFTQQKIIFNRSQSVYKEPAAVLVPVLRISGHWFQLRLWASTPGCSSVTEPLNTPTAVAKFESVGSGGSRLISSSSLWVSWPAWGTGYQSHCPRWLFGRERRRWEEAWSSLCHFLDHPEWEGKKTDENEQLMLYAVPHKHFTRKGIFWHFRNFFC